MTPHPPAPPDPALAALERRVRWLTAVCVFLGLGLLLVYVRPWLPQAPDLSGRSLTLSDTAGVMRAQIGTLVDGTSFIRINDPAGRVRWAALARPEGSPEMYLVGDEGLHRMRLELADDGRPLLQMLAPEGLGRITVAPHGGGVAPVAIRGTDTLWLAP